MNRMWSNVGAIALVAFAPALTTLTGQQAEPARSVWDGVYSKDQVERGNALYTRYCPSCHGPDLNGAEQAPPLAGGAFLSNWDGLTLGDLSERIRVSMPFDDPGRLSRQQVADLLAFMLSVNGFPAGTAAELPREAELLKQIKFEAMRKP